MKCLPFGKSKCMKTSIILILSLLSTLVYGQTTYLYCGHVLDCKGSNASSEKTIIVENDRIKAIENGYLEAPDTVDVVDLNEMGRETVVQKVGREHHAVTSIPELGLILLIEVHDLSTADESESAEDHVSRNNPNEETRVVQGSILQTNKAREHGSLHAQSLVNHQPPVVHQAHDAAEGVLAILTLAHL